MLGSPNLSIGGGTLTPPAITVFRPTKDVGVYVQENSTPDQQYKFIAKSSPGKNKTRFSYEIVRTVNQTWDQSSTPDLNVRVYVVLEYDNVTQTGIVNAENAITESIGLLSSVAMNPSMRAASARGEV